MPHAARPGELHDSKLDVLVSATLPSQVPEDITATPTNHLLAAFRPLNSTVNF